MTTAVLCARHPAWAGVVGLALYGWTVAFEYVALDDPWLIRDNPLLQAGASLPLLRIFFDLSPETRMMLGAEYLPLRDISTWLDSFFFGTWWGGRHLHNTLLYAVCVALVGVLLSRVFSIAQSAQRGRQMAWFGTLLFAVHPVHVETVAWLSERKGLLASAFALTAVLLAQSFAKRGKGGTAILALLCFVCAILSKSFAVVTPGAMLGLCLFERGRAAQKRTIVIVGLACLLGALAIQPTLYVGNQMHMAKPVGRSLLEAFALLLELQGRYVALFALALPNAPHYPIDATSLNRVFITLGGSTLCLLVYCLLRFRRQPTLALGALIWLLFLFPVSHLIFPLQNLMADRYLFVPSVGACLIASALWGRLPAKVRPVISAAVLLFAVFVSVGQTPTWRDSQSLFTNLATQQPKVASHWNQLAAELERQGRHKEAFAITISGIESAGPAPALLHRRGLLLRKQGRLEAGFRDIELAAKHDGADSKYVSNYALLLAQSGRVDEAMLYARKAATQSPFVAHTQRVLGLVALQFRSFKEAEVAFGQALRLEPNNLVNQKNVEALRDAQQASDDTSR